VGKRIATAYSYTRFSSPEQAKGDSIRRQTNLRDAWLLKSGAMLDTSIVLRDAGVSAFSGGHRDNPDRHALAAFLELVKKGRIPKGSFLIVESLDRLTREHIRPALTLLLNLIDAGIRIVQLLPVEHVYDESVDPMTLVMAIMELSRGHSESKMKSERVGAAWREKKKRAKDGEILTRAIPGWLRVEEGKFKVDPAAARSVKLIFRMTIDGHGIGAIVKHLNGKGIEPIGRAKYWGRSYVSKILVSRSVFGEYQPHRGHAGANRKPEGKPIPNYYPAVVDETTFYAARSASSGRRGKAGRPGKTFNLFSSLLRDALDGSTIIRVDKGERAAGPQFVSYFATLGKPGSTYISFPADVFETAVLSQLRELDPKEILPRDEPHADEVMALTGRLADLEARVEAIKAKLISGGDLDALTDVLRTLETDRVAVNAELALARNTATVPLRTAWDQFGTLAEVLDAAPDRDDASIRLRAALRRIVTKIDCVFVKRGRIRLAAAQIQFEGGRHRDYLIVFWPKHANAASNTPPRHVVRSFAAKATKQSLDFRKREDAEKVKKVLEAMEIPT
jgi:DNA invertase Pin-like site-specific DNA recombinase